MRRVRTGLEEILARPGDLRGARIGLIAHGASVSAELTHAVTLLRSSRAVRLAGKKVELAAKEFALLHALAEQPTHVYGKNELLRDVWGFQSMGRTRTLDAHACRLRKKLSPSSRPWVVNVRGVGYKLTEAV